MKKKLSSILSLILILSAFFSIRTFAAVNYPSISANNYIEFTAQENIYVYKDTACKTRGTSSPSRKYNASISKGDTCYIYKITKSYIQINYPTSSGRRTGYIKRTSLFDKTSPVEYISSAKAKVNVHKTSAGSHIAKKDKVWRVDPKKGYNNYRAVIYEAKSGKRAYKMGYISITDLDKIKGKSTDNVSSTTNSSNVSKISNKIDVVKEHSDTWSSLLNQKKRTARAIIDTVNMVNKQLSIQKTLGVSTVAVVNLNPFELLNLMDEDAAIGMLCFTATEMSYDSAVSSHNSFNKLIKNIKTEKDAELAFASFVDALARYDAIAESNIETVDRYNGNSSNYRIDMLNEYFSSTLTAFIPAGECAAVLKACSSASNVMDMVDIVSGELKSNSVFLETKSTWYSYWNNL